MYCVIQASVQSLHRRYDRDGHGLRSMAIHMACHRFSFNMRLTLHDISHKVREYFLYRLVTV